MDGFVAGVNHYNKTKGTSVSVLGWDPASREGLFTNNFSSLDDGRAFAQNLYDEGADIVMPVAGPVGLGSAALASELGTDSLKIIGVDVDQYVKDPKNQSVYLTTVEKVWMLQFSCNRNAKKDIFAGGLYVGTLANNGVRIAPYHDLSSSVSNGLNNEIKKLRSSIINGFLSVKN